MPMSESQIEKIKSYLDKFIVLGANVQEVQDSIKQFNALLRNIQSNLSQEQMQVKKYFDQQPHLLIEKSENTLNLTYGEIRQAIIDVIDKKITNTASSLKISEKTLEKIWKKSDILLAAATSQDRNLIFPIATRIIKKKLATDTIASYKALIIYESSQLYLSVTVTYAPNLVLHHKILYPTPPSEAFANESNTKNYFDSLMPQALITAKQTAAALIYKHLTEREISIDHPNLANHPACEHFLQCITSEYWLSLFLNKFVSINEFMRISPQPARNFANKNVIELLRLNILTHEIAAALSETDLKIIDHPDYFKMITDYPALLIELTSLQPDEQIMLCQSGLAHLIKNKKLSIEKAKKFTPALVTLLFDPIYFEKANKENPNWDKLLLLTNDDIIFLLNVKTIEKITEYRLELDEIVLLKNHLQQAISNSDLGLIKKIKYTSEIIYSYDQIKLALRHEVITIDSLLQCTLEQNAFTIFTTRLIAIFKQKPVKLTGYDDNVTSVNSDIKKLVDSAKLNKSVTELKEQCTKELLKYILDDLTTKPFSNVYAKSKQAELYRHITKAFDINQNISHPHWQETLKIFVNMAKTLSNQFPSKEMILEKSYPIQFGQINLEIEKLRELCDNISSFSSLLPSERQTYGYNSYN